MAMLTSLATAPRRFSRLHHGHPCRSTLVLSLSLCAVIGIGVHVAHLYSYQVWTEGLMPYPRIEDEEALVDNKTKSMEDLTLEAAANVRNIPLPPYILGKEYDGPKYFQNFSCARFPTINDIEFSNIYWQVLRTWNGTLYLYGAYFDIRKINPLGPTVRILGMMDRMDPSVTTHCQIWFNGETEPVFSQVVAYDYIWNKTWGQYEEAEYHPYLLACPVPGSHHGKVPASVSVVEQPCYAANNNLRVIFNKPAKKKGFAVCVKAFDYVQEDLSVQLVEWIELMDILGADKIFTYEQSLHPNSSKVLRYYEQTGKVEVTPITLPGSHPNDPHLLHMFMRNNLVQRYFHEVISLNDCMYSHLYEYEYFGVFDTDEVIMPLNAKGWKELMLEVSQKSGLTYEDSIPSYSFQQLHFVDDVGQGHKLFEGIPKYMYMLQNVYRAPQHKHPLDNIKCFQDPESVLTVHNHFPLDCLNHACTNYYVETDVAQLNHYKKYCLLGEDECTEEYRESTLMDTTIWRYKDELINRSRTVLGSLGFIPSVAT